jgi:6-phosphogluconate dehydrogenase
MVHNGIEYAMMQLISEAYDVMKRGCGLSNEELHKVFLQWNNGNLQSFLIEITAEIFRTLDTETVNKTDYLVDYILDKAGSKGTGKWTSQDALNIGVPIPTIDAAVAARILSAYKDQRIQAARLYNNSVETIAAAKFIEQLEDALFFSFIIAYAQGLSLLAKASEEYNFQIPLPEVVSIWKGGCIIRSALLYQFDKAFAGNANLENVLLDASVAELLKQKQEAIREVLSLAIKSNIPVAAMSSALSYFDAYCSERLPTNLIQAQRDFFGAHTYQRIDKEGVFHTEWNVDSNAQA